MANLQRPAAGESETPGALAGATGGKSTQNKASDRLEGYQNDPAGAMWRFAQPRHKRAARVIFAALVGGDWRGVAEVLRHKLTDEELADLALVIDGAQGRVAVGLPTDPAWRRMFAEVAAESRRDLARMERMAAEAPL